MKFTAVFSPRPPSSPTPAGRPSPAEVFRDQHRWMRKRVRSLGVSAVDVDDVLQLVAQDLVRHPERIPGHIVLRAWLRTVTLRRAYDHLVLMARRARREVPLW